MRKQTVALVMIVRNEELGLERAIQSCFSFVSEIVIAVDRSSTDKTLEIAKKYATTLKEFDWRDDFGWARNFAQEGVKSDWILAIDGHEFVDKCEKLQDYLNSDADGLLCTVELESGPKIRNPRLFKNGIVWVGKVHEHQLCKKTIFYREFLIKHGRLDGQSITSQKLREEQRNDQVPRIMGEELRRNPRNTRASFHLALFAQATGAFRAALRYQKIYLRYAVSTPERWFVQFSRSLTFLALGRNWRAFWSANRCDDEVAGRWETQKLKGLIFFQSQKYERAIECLVNSFHQNTVDEAYAPWPRDDSGTFNLIGECYYRLGILDKASIAFDRASELAKTDDVKNLCKKRANLMIAMIKNTVS